MGRAFVKTITREILEPATVTFTLPYPPSVNNLYTNGRGHGRRVLTKVGREYKEDAALLAAGAGAKPLTCDVRVSLKVYRPRKCGDLDNSLKVIFDSITGIGWKDDGQVRVIRAIRFEDKENPRVIVRIEAMGEWLDETDLA
jgi:Holliday junction resolvase RusA-like endonuclease